MQHRQDGGSNQDQRLLSVSFLYCEDTIHKPLRGSYHFIWQFSYYRRFYLLPLLLERGGCP
jgi:hypothetical protein